MLLLDRLANKKEASATSRSYQRAVAVVHGAMTVVSAGGSIFRWGLFASIAPKEVQDKAGRSDFPHFAIRGTRGENAADAVYCLFFHTKNGGLRKS